MAIFAVFMIGKAKQVLFRRLEWKDLNNGNQGYIRSKTYDESTNYLLQTYATEENI